MVKMRNVIKPYDFADGKNGIIRGKKKGFGVIDFTGIKIIRHRHAHFLFENFTHIGRIVMKVPLKQLW